MMIVKEGVLVPHYSINAHKTTALLYF